jgi:hypothetical protein
MVDAGKVVASWVGTTVVAGRDVGSGRKPRLTAGLLKTKKISKSMNQTNNANTDGTVPYGTVVYDKDCINYEIPIKLY